MNPKYPHDLVLTPNPADEAEVRLAFEDEDAGVVLSSSQLDNWAETGDFPWQGSSGSGHGS